MIQAPGRAPAAKPADRRTTSACGLKLLTRTSDRGSSAVSAKKMSSAWAAFARTGDPNHKGLPKWEPFTADKRATLIFNNECRAVNDPYRDERLAVAAALPARMSQ